MDRPKRRKWDVAAEAPPPAAASAAAAPQPSRRFSAQPPAGVVAPPVPQAAAPPLPLDEDAIKRAQAAAQAVLNRLAPPPRPAAPAAAPEPVHVVAPQRAQELGVDVSINDAAAAMRIHLTRKPTHAVIEARRGVTIVVRGRYYPPGAARGEEAPLHLHITPAGTVPQVSKAADLGKVGAHALEASALITS